MAYKQQPKMGEVLLPPYYWSQADKSTPGPYQSGLVEEKAS